MTGERAQGLRIGLVCPYSFDTPGGVQNHVLGLARHLAEQGHHPHILAPGDVEPPKVPRSATDTESPVLPAGTHFTSAGATVPVRYNGSVARVSFGPLGAARARRWLRDGDFDLVHIHEPITPSISMLALWAADVPVVATFHTATPRSRTMQLAGGAMRAAVEKIDAGIAVSESARKVVVQHLGRDALVIPNGFRFADFTGPNESDPGWGSDSLVGRWRGGAHPRLSFLGRMDEPRKGLDTLLAALPQVRTFFPDLDVIIAGQGRRSLPFRCRALGLVSDRQKAALLGSSDLFVAPHVARESFGIVLLEAMASGTPVVASDLPAFADILAPAGAVSARPLGVTFPVGDAAALARAVVSALAEPDVGRTDAARQASRAYDWDVIGAAITEVYRATRGVASLVRGRSHPVRVGTSR